MGDAMSAARHPAWVRGRQDGRSSTDPRADDGGSVMVLLLGYVVLALVVLLVAVEATGLFLAQKRVDALADAAALAAADGFTIESRGTGAVAVLNDADVRDQASAVVAEVEGARLVDAQTVGGVSARVTVATEWHPVILALFVPDGVTVEAEATSRTALR